MTDKKITRYLEDFREGAVLECGSYTFSEAEIIRFASEFDPQPFHIDREAAARSVYGGIIASGWHTVSVMMRLMVDGYITGSSSMGSPGVDQVRWLKPVRPGDTITARAHINAVIPSKSKPDRGIVKSLMEVSNQHDEIVMTVLGMGMYLRRPARNRLYQGSLIKTH